MKTNNILTLKSFIHLNEAEMDFALKLRNSDEVRSFCLDQHIISHEEQVKFIHQLKRDMYRFYFLTLFNDEMHGVYSFSINKEKPNLANAGMYFKPNSRINTLAYHYYVYIAYLTGVRYFYDHVFKHNTKAIQICKFRNDELIEDPNNNQVYIMKSNITYIKEYIKTIQRKDLAVKIIL